MALSEFVALEAAYRALQPLDATARGRALRWLTDALGVQDRLAESSESPAYGENAGSVPSSATRPGAGVPEPAPTTESAVATKGASAKELAAGETTEVDTSAGSPETVADGGNRAGAPESTDTAEPDAAPIRGNRRRAAAAGTKSHRRGRGGKQQEKERVYRRMPPANEVLAAYKKVGTVSGLAGYFDVPRHTVQGWARRLRSAGYEIGRKSEAGE